MADAVAVVDARPAQRPGVDLLAERLAHDARAGEEHRRVLGHQDQVGEGRRIGAASGRGAGDHRDLGDDPGQPDGVAEDAAVACERRGAFLHAGAARLHERDDWDPGTLCQLEHAHDRLGVELAERAAQVGAVLGVADDRAAVDRAGRAHDAVARDGALAEPRGEGARAQDIERAGVAQRLQALERVKSDRGGDGGRRGHCLTPCITSATLWPPNAKEFEIAAGTRPLPVTSGRASSGT